MSEQIFKEIRSIEEEAAKITLHAERQAADVLKKARDRAVQLRSEIESEFTARRETELKKAVKEAAGLKQKRIDKAAAAIKELKAAAERKRNKAVNLVLDGLSQRIGE